MGREQPSFVRAVSSHAFLLAFGATMLLPFLWMVSTSLKGEAEVFQRNLLPQAVSLGDEGTPLATAAGAPIRAVATGPDGRRIPGEQLVVRLGSPVQQGTKGDRARTPDGEGLSDDIGMPVQLGNVGFDSPRLNGWGGLARFRDPRVFVKFAEPVTVPAGFAAPGFDPVANEAAARRWFCDKPGRYGADGAWDRLKRSRFAGRVPLMVTPAMYDAWAPRSGKAEPVDIGGVPLPNFHPKRTTEFCQFKNLTWGVAGEPVRDLTLPAVLCRGDGEAVRYQPAFPIFRTPDDPLRADERTDLVAFVGAEAAPRAVTGAEVALQHRMRLVWSNYQTVLTDPDVKMTLFAWNSLFIAVCVVVLQLATCSLAAFAFSRIEWPGRDQIFICYLGTLMVPGAVTMIPNYLILQQLGWLNSFFGLIVPASASAYGTFMLRQYMLTLPKGLEEAARIDGASQLRVWWDIVLPLCKPALITLAIFAFAGAWGSFTWPLIIAPDEGVRVLPVALRNFSGAQSNSYTLLMAASLVMMLPMLLLFIFGQKYFVKGIQLGGVKG